MAHFAHDRPTSSSASSPAIKAAEARESSQQQQQQQQKQPPRGPHPGQVMVTQPFVPEQCIRHMMARLGTDPARDTYLAITGVQLIDNVREHLQLPVRTFNTASIYYHRFRLAFRDSEYNWQDAAIASLFLACKVEDTIKKSKDILVALSLVKNPGRQSTMDDKALDQLSKIVIGLERRILETIGFDFRTRYPQKTTAKLCRHLLTPSGAYSSDLAAVAYDMSVDLHKTFAPLKQTTHTMALALIELAALVTNLGVDVMRGVDPTQYGSDRASVVETMLDLLDLYTLHQKSTKVGLQFDLQRFIDVKIAINREVDATPGLGRHARWCAACEETLQQRPRSAAATVSPGTVSSFPGGASLKRGSVGGGSGNSGETTLRFLFDADRARQEEEVVGPFFHDDYEEIEVEVREEIPEPERPIGPSGGQYHPYGPRRDRHHGPGPGGYDHHSWNNRNRPRGGGADRGGGGGGGRDRHGGPGGGYHRGRPRYY